MHSACSNGVIMLNKKQIAKYIQPLATIPTGFSPSGKIGANIRCVLFDIYGTLFISGSGDIGIAKREVQHEKALKELFEKYGISSNPRPLLKDLYRSIELRHQALRNEGVDFPEIEIDRIWMDILNIKNPETIKNFAVEFEWIRNPVYPMPHLNELLAAIKMSAVLMGIISNAQFFTPYLFPWTLDSLPEELGFHPNLILFSYRYGHAKPSRFLFDRAAQELDKLNIPTNEALYVGNDMLNDICPAKMCGFKTVLFAGDRRSLRLRKDDSRCENISADIVITDLIQLLDHIGVT
jgi:putative hydrolase of the HAD superfamily